MYADFANRGIAALNDDFIDVGGNQFADDRIAAGIVRCDGDALPGLATDRVVAVGDGAGGRRGALATASASCDVMGRRSPWPMAATRSAQLSSLGNPPSGAASGPKFRCKNHMGW